ncbi:MAG: ATP-binding cassette domain-containing protein [Clostridium sp.]|nr:ATP-binding cassette domain-containing protein [Clostridium sp.]
MRRIEEIRLNNVLPNVFADRADRMGKSEIWLGQAVFLRGGRYIVTAESGTGKSSMCSYIYGNRSDYQGEILFDGRNIRTFSMKDWCDVRCAGISILPQELRLFPELTAYENIEIKNRLTSHCTKAQIMEMLERLEISDKADVKAGKMSVGQQQRVAIARAMCQPFSFLFLDEPVSHLDERNNRIAGALMQECAERQGAAIVATSVGNNVILEGDITYLAL